MCDVHAQCSCTCSFQCLGGKGSPWIQGVVKGHHGHKCSTVRTFLVHAYAYLCTLDECASCLDQIINNDHMTAFRFTCRGGKFPAGKSCLVVIEKALSVNKTIFFTSKHKM